MRRLVFLGVPDCPLTAHGQRVLEALAADRLLVWTAVATDTDRGRELQSANPDLPPVLFDESGRVLAHGRLSDKRLRRELAGSAHETSQR